MKRSEIHKLFAKEYNRISGYDNPRDLSEIFLEIAEQVGMLPPYDKKAHMSDLSLRKDTLEYCKWEPEDEI